MAIEFIGIGFFSFLMGSFNSILVQESKLQDIIDEKIEDLDIWLRKLDKSRNSKHLPKILYDNVKGYVESSFLLDFNLIQTFEFFDQLKPKLRYKLINELFGQFKQNFYYMFEDDEFEAGQEFMADFLANLYCRIYLPHSDIIKYGESFPELYLIYKGVVLLSLKGVSSKENEFLLLPTYSYFGDYQLILNLRSQIVYKSGDHDITYTMCIKRSRFLKLLEEYPDAKRFYVQRAVDRRVEFRRKMKKHMAKVAVQQNMSKRSSGNNKLTESSVDKQDSDSLSSSNSSDQDQMEPDAPNNPRTNTANPRIDQLAASQKKMIAKVSEYFNEDAEEQFVNDFTWEELAEISESERYESREE